MTRRPTLLTSIFGMFRPRLLPATVDEIAASMGEDLARLSARDFTGPVATETESTTRELLDHSDDVSKQLRDDIQARLELFTAWDNAWTQARQP